MYVKFEQQSSGGVAAFLLQEVPARAAQTQAIRTMGRWSQAFAEANAEQRASLPPIAATLAGAATMSRPVSPQRQARASVRAAATSRGHANQNIWIQYSPKIGQDVIPQSDLQLVHWIAYLETAHKVSNFILGPALIQTEVGELQVAVDAMVSLCDGHKQLHQIAANADDPEVQAAASIVARAIQPMQHVVVCVAELEAQSHLASRWLEPLAYAAALRAGHHTPCGTTLLANVLAMRTGTVGDLIDLLAPVPASAVCGELVLLAVKSRLTIDLSARPFGCRTAWTWDEDA